MTKQAPDYAEPVVGWRLWQLTKEKDVTRLASLVHSAVWHPGAALVAECRCLHLRVWPFKAKRHEAPDVSCRCGIHATTAEAMHSYLPSHYGLSMTFPVFGRVAMWGEVHEYERGWRASHAYPQSLYVPICGEPTPARLQAVEDLKRYGVPVYALAAPTADAVIREARQQVA